MIRGESKVLQAFLGTLMTWGLTAAGSALVFVFNTGNFRGKRKILDGSLGFAAGVMTAASYWSLLAPGIEMATQSGYYGDEGEYAFGPVAIGFVFGGLFVLVSDLCLPRFTKEDPAVALAMHSQHKEKHGDDQDDQGNTVMSALEEEENKRLSVEIVTASPDGSSSEMMEMVPENDEVVEDSVKLNVRNRNKKKTKKDSNAPQVVLEYKIAGKSKEEEEKEKARARYKSWLRILLLVIAITVHNIPEGLAVGVAFGAIGSSASATFESARNLAIGIGIQNFPEGMAVSIPLCAAGYSPLKSFWYGQLSGMVEPIFGVLGSLIVVVATPLLPYALAFAAGAMIYVVVDDIIPEANMCGNGRIASWGCMVGFIIMMCLDVGLG